MWFSSASYNSEKPKAILFRSNSQLTSEEVFFGIWVYDAGFSIKELNAVKPMPVIPVQ